MASLFQTTKNTRYLAASGKRYLRSDVPDKLSREEEDWLLENNYLTVVDLREKGETEERKCALQENDRFHYINLPVTGGNKIPELPCMVARSYIKMVDERMWEIIDTIENAESNVLFFCNAGKDRTGVVSALILSRMGAERKDIVEDYVASAENLRETLHLYAEQNPAIDINVITPKQEYMEEFLDWYEKVANESDRKGRQV